MVIVRYIKGWSNISRWYAVTEFLLCWQYFCMSALHFLHRPLSRLGYKRINSKKQKSRALMIVWFFYAVWVFFSYGKSPFPTKCILKTFTLGTHFSRLWNYRKQEIYGNLIKVGFFNVIIQDIAVHGTND